MAEFFKKEGVGLEDQHRVAIGEELVLLVDGDIVGFHEQVISCEAATIIIMGDCGICRLVIMALAMLKS